MNCMVQDIEQKYDRPLSQGPVFAQHGVSTVIVE